MTDIDFRAPALPYPPTEYNKSTFTQLNNVLRIYFNQLDDALRNIAVATPNDFYLEVAKGNIVGHSAVHKFGANFDVSTGTTPETIWSAGGLYPWSVFPIAQTLYILSTSASDTMGVVVEGLDENYQPQTETVTLTGTTAVTTTNTFVRVFRMATDVLNVGDITARVTSASGTVVAQIDTGYGQTLMAIYTVPAGQTAYMTALDTTVQKNKDAQIRLFQRPTNQDFRIAHMAETFESSYRYDFAPPLRFPEKTDLEIRASEADTNNTRVIANFDLVLAVNT